MKFWHRWRYKVWYMRYLEARGRLVDLRGAEHTMAWMSAEAERATAASAVEYHHTKAGL